MSARRVSVSGSRFDAVSTAVFSPEKLKSRSPESSIGRGSVSAPSRPPSASAANAGPPG